jgi:hypothetical protein
LLVRRSSTPHIWLPYRTKRKQRREKKKHGEKLLPRSHDRTPRSPSIQMALTSSLTSGEHLRPRLAPLRHRGAQDNVCLRRWRGRRAQSLPPALRITLSLEGRGEDCICSASVTRGAGSGRRHDVEPMLVGAGIAWRRWGRAPTRKRRHGGKLLWRSQTVGVASPLRTETMSPNVAPKVRASLCL